MAKAQTTGRIGELSVELELTSRDWLVGNFNSNIQNAAVYDLFAVKKNNKKLIRVKSYSLFDGDKGTIQYTSRKTGEIFLDLLKENKDDFVILCGVSNGKVKEYFMDKNEKKLFKDNNMIILTEKEIKLIELLMNSAKPISKDKILSSVWNYSADADTHTVETHIYRLRKKIHDKFTDEKFILNNKAGYYI